MMGISNFSILLVDGLVYGIIDGLADGLALAVPWQPAGDSMMEGKEFLWRSG
jgi:hypothetical protein